MNPAQIVLSQLVKVALLAALAGTFARGRHRLCWSFPAYLTLVLACDTLVSLWPERFYVYWFWMLQQSLWDVGKLAIALELAWRCFKAFPGARPATHLALGVVLSLTTAAILSLPPGLSYAQVVFQWHPRVLTGTIWLMTALALLVVWYRIPLLPFQKAILVGFVPYLVVFVSLLNVLRHHGWQVREWVNLLDATAYLGAASWWAWAAWRPEESYAVSPAVARRLGLDTP